MCSRPTPSYRSVSASAGALGVSVLNAFQALALLLLALATAPVRQLAWFRHPRRTAALAHVDVQVHLGDRACVAELESIVKKLEEGDLPLEQSLRLYERGVELSRFCHSRLEEAERRIEILNERGEVKPAPSSLAADPPSRS